MDYQEQNFNVVLKIMDVEVYFVDEGQTNLISKGTLNLAEIPESESYAIIVGEFRYLINNQIPVMGRRQNTGESLYVLPNVTGFYGLKTPATTQASLTEIFEVIIQQTSELVMEAEEPVTPTPPVEQKPSSSFVLKKSADYQPNPIVVKESVVVTKSTSTKPKIIPERERVKAGGSEPEETKAKNDQVKSDSSVKSADKTAVVSSTIAKGGELVRDGLLKAAEITSVGITSAGKYISRKFMKKNKDVEIKSETMTKLKIAKTTTKAVAMVTKVQIKALLGAAAMIGKELGKQFESSDKGKKLQEQPAYNVAKKIGTSAIQATATIYDGMFGALCTLGKGISNTTTDVLTYKYGDQMGKASNEVFEGVGNIGAVLKAVPMEAAKAISDTKGDNQKK